MQKLTPSFHSFLPVWLWLYFPLVLLLLQTAGEIFLSQNLLLSLHAENSVHEFVQFGLLFASFMMLVMIFFKMDRSASPWLAAWIVLATLSCLYVAGEEISWGQWLFQWQTPAEWAAVNEQNETNLHNTSRLLNHIPRYILMAGVAVGGLIIPALTLLKPSILPARFSVIYPPPVLGVTALCLLVVALGHKLAKTYFDIRLFERASEVEEIFMFFFVFLYVLVMRSRIMGKG
jgi:hypothetical protein